MEHRLPFGGSQWLPRAWWSAWRGPGPGGGGQAPGRVRAAPGPAEPRARPGHGTETGQGVVGAGAARTGARTWVRVHRGALASEGQESQADVFGAVAPSHTGAPGSDMSVERAPARHSLTMVLSSLGGLLRVPSRCRDQVPPVGWAGDTALGTRWPPAPGRFRGRAGVCGEGRASVLGLPGPRVRIESRWGAQGPKFNHRPCSSFTGGNSPG